MQSRLPGPKPESEPPMKTRRNATMPQWASDSGDFPLAIANGAQRQPVDAQSPRVSEISTIKTTAKILKFHHGLYALNIAQTPGPANEHSGIVLPATHIANPPSDELGTAEIVAASGDSASWLGPEGGTVVIKVPLGGAHVLITTYEPDDELCTPLEVEIRRLDLPSREPVAAAHTEPPPEPVTREIKTEVLLHIERAGDRRVAARGWVGNRGEKLRIEGFSIYPLETLAAGDIEYKAFGPNARETPWLSDA